MKPYSEACERNKDAILQVIEPLLKTRAKLLEVGSGNGQHAVYFAKQLPELTWQTSDCAKNHADICMWLDEYTGSNVCRPIALDVLQDPWPNEHFDAVYSANTAHIMSWKAVKAFISGVGQALSEGGFFILYGPFNYNGTFTSESNLKFEDWLKSVDPARGIRDFESVNKLAQQACMTLLDDIEMPANNRIIVWRKL